MDDIVVTSIVYTLKALACVYDILTYIPYYLVQRPDRVLAKSARVKAKPTNGNPRDPWRSVDVLNRPLSSSLFPPCETLSQLFERACKVHVNRPCLGTRDVLSEEEEKQPNGKVFKKLVLGDYQWLTYQEVHTRVHNFGRGLMAMGQMPKSKLVIFAETQADWMISAEACFSYNFPVVTLYATLGVDAVFHGINETKPSHVITSLDLLPKFKDILPKTHSVTHLIVIGCTKSQLQKANFAAPDGIIVISIEEVEALGANPEHSGIVPNSPETDDIAVIMYTSGSTGLPKGVMISHRNLMCGTSGQVDRIPGLGTNDVYIGYLPLAHVLELSAEVSCLAMGTRIGYSSPNTLTDKSTKIKRGSKGDVSVLKPTLIAAVPMILDRIYKTVWDNVRSSSKVKQALFKFAFDYKLRHLQNGFNTPLCNKVVFKSVRAILGGNVRLMLSGGAPLSATTQRFMNVCFCCPLGQGYGLTETCGAGTVIDFCDLSVERVGAPLVCCEIKLRDWVEGNYTADNKPYPQGEILISGGNVALGYYKNPDKTEEDFQMVDGVRYFCTGDIGQFESDGCLRIIDRKKDLVKLQHGEYISLSQVETVLKMCPIVEQICVVANSHMTSVVALIVPNEAKVMTLARGLGIDNSAFREVCENQAVVAAVQKDISTHGLKTKLQRIEIPSKISLLPDPWLPDNGLVTDAYKLKRKVIEERFQVQIQAMYSPSS